MYNTPFKLDDFEYLVIQPTKARPAVDLHMKYVGCGNEPAWVYKKLKDCQGGGIFAYNKKSPYMESYVLINIIQDCSLNEKPDIFQESSFIQMSPRYTPTGEFEMSLFQEMIADINSGRATSTDINDATYFTQFCGKWGNYFVGPDPLHPTIGPEALLENIGYNYFLNEKLHVGDDIETLIRLNKKKVSKAAKKVPYDEIYSDEFVKFVHDMYDELVRRYRIAFPDGTDKYL